MSKIDGIKSFSLNPTSSNETYFKLKIIFWNLTNKVIYFNKDQNLDIENIIKKESQLYLKSRENKLKRILNE
jgi:hypothetical protein